MAQIRSAEGQIELNCNADKLFDIWGRNTLELSKICPDKIPKLELLQGNNCHTPGAVICWTFPTPVDGKQEYVKTLLEEIDVKNRKLRYNLIEGEMMDKYYKTWKEGPEVIPKGENRCIAKWVVYEYEKKCEDAPDPKLYIDFLLDCLKDTASHISCAN